MSKFSEDQIFSKLNDIQKYELKVESFKDYIESQKQSLGIKLSIIDEDEPSTVQEGIELLNRIHKEIASILDRDSYEFDNYMEARETEESVILAHNKVMIVARSYNAPENSIPFNNLTYKEKSVYAENLLQVDEYQEELDRIVKKFECELEKAQKLATEKNLSFSIYPSYGMGGEFSNGEWYPSSESC